MSVIIDGTAGITTPSETNTGTLSVTGVTTLTGGLNAALPVLSGGTGVTTSTGTGSVVLGTGPSISSAVMTTMASSVITSATAKSTATCSFTGVIAGTALTASAITGTITVGQLITGTGVTAGTTIISGSGTAWVVSVSQTVSSTAITVVGIDFTGIPSWVKRITVMFNGVSTNGISYYMLRLGTSSGIVSTGYVSMLNILYSSIQFTASTTGFQAMAVAAADTHGGQIVISNFGLSNVWVVSGAIAASSTVSCVSSGFSPNLGGTLDRIRLTTVNGTDTFDAGSVNILYE